VIDKATVLDAQTLPRVDTARIADCGRKGGTRRATHRSLDDWQVNSKKLTKSSLHKRASDR
jgi:hypothetical protein